MTVVHQRQSKRNKKERDYITLTAFVPNRDEEHPDPKIYVEQRTYDKDNDGLQQERTVVQQLVFGQNIRLGVTYVFKGCGDERRGIGEDDNRQKKRDLHVRFFSVVFPFPLLLFYPLRTLPGLVSSHLHEVL